MFDERKLEQDFLIWCCSNHSSHCWSVEVDAPGLKSKVASYMKRTEPQQQTIETESPSKKTLEEINNMSLKEFSAYATDQLQSQANTQVCDI